DMTLTLKINGITPSVVESEDAPAMHAAPPLAEDDEIETAAYLPWRDYAAFFALDADFPTPNTDAPFGEACDFALEPDYDLADGVLALKERAPAPLQVEHWF